MVNRGKKEYKMEKKNIDWGNIGFGYIPTDYRYVSNYKDGKWDDGQLTQDPNIVLNECAGVLQYAQTVFEGLKAYTTEDGHIVTFRPDLNGERLESSAARLEMPISPRSVSWKLLLRRLRRTMLSCLLTAAAQLCTFVLICSAATLSLV